MDRVVVTKICMPTGGLRGLACMQVCCVKDATDDEILQVCNKENPSGTTNGWTTVLREDNDSHQGIVKCADNYVNRTDRVHILISC